MGLPGETRGQIRGFYALLPLHGCWGLNSGLPCVPSHLTGPERNTSKEKGLDLACRLWLAVYTVSRSLVRQHMVVDGYGSKAA